MTEIAVIIPFFQRRAKLLGITVASIMAQRVGDARFTIVIVDDGSPVPAEDALKDVPVPDPHRLIVVRQPNGGPGAARNRGIEEALKLGSDFVAFIDSDDAWAPDHLARGIDALREEESDYYFSDILNDGEPEFRKLRFMKANLLPEEFHEPVVKTLDSRSAVDAIAVECLPHMSTIVCKSAVQKASGSTNVSGGPARISCFYGSRPRCHAGGLFDSAGRRARRGRIHYRATMSWGLRRTRACSTNWPIGNMRCSRTT